MSYKSIIAILLISLTQKTIAQVNKPDEFFQPTAPSSAAPYTLTNYSSVNLNSPVFNHIRTYTPRTMMSSINNSIFSKNGVNTVYINGFGKPLQSISMGKGGESDIVIPFDQRASLDQLSFLPYPIPSNSTFQSNPFVGEQSYYNGTTSGYNLEGGYSFSRNKLTSIAGVTYNSEYAPGLSLIGSNRGNTAYQYYNVANDGNIPMLTIDATSGNPISTGNYSYGEIIVKVQLGQHAAISKMLYDKSNKLIAKKVKEGNNWLETWYVYDDFGKLAWVLPPKSISYSSGNMNVPTGSLLTNLCYQYQYDKYGAVIKKQVPDQDGSNQVIYDVRQRPVLTTTPKLYSQHKWMFTAYDDQDRVIMSGIFTDPENLSRQDIQARVTNVGNWPSGITYQQIFDYIWFVPTSGYPSSIANCEIHTYNYYDNYGTDLPSPMSGVNPVYYNSDYFTGADYKYPTVYPQLANGKLVATKTKVLDPSNNNLYIYTVFFYDVTGRLVQTQSLHPWNNNNWNVEALQYDFSGNLVLNIKDHYSWSGTNKASTKIITKYNYNMLNGKLGNVQQKIDGGPWLNLSNRMYDDLRRVKQKTVGDAEVRNIKYNIRGQLTGINPEYVYDNTLNTMKTFGEIICYDYGYNQKRYDGSIAGYMWRGSGMADCPRSYGYIYDDAGRLTKADFYQRWHPNGPLAGPNTIIWNNADVDYTVSDIAYDFNGNMQSMKQRGMAAVTSGGTTTLQPVDLDQLTYGYNANSNKLLNVTDQATYNINDFLDGNKHITTSVDDYEYDEDGNLKKDVNKGISQILYNHLDLPLSVTSGSNSINNIYDGAGNLLQKTIVENGNTTTYRYWGPFVYKDNNLQYVLHEEGRSRYIAASNSFEHDYFVKDHLDNVRTVVNAEISYGITSYNAGFEMAYANVEEGLFDNIGGVRDVKPMGAPGDIMSGFLHGAIDSQRIGASIIIHAMAGDQLNLKGYGYYEDDDSTNMNTYSMPEDMLNSLVNTIGSGTNGLQTENVNIPGLPPGTAGMLLSPINYNEYENLKNSITDPAYPRAYLNYLVFNEMMEIVPDKCKIVQLTGSKNSWIQLDLGNMSMDMNGYVLAYFSNESNLPVYVDNEHLVNVKGRLLEENHYYPHGLCVEAGGQSTTPLRNDYLHQTKKLQRELGLELYDFHARQYDAQIGRFWGIDPADQFPSGYTGMGNDPANNIDPSGMTIMPTGGLDDHSVTMPVTYLNDNEYDPTSEHETPDPRDNWKDKEEDPTSANNAKNAENQTEGPDPDHYTYNEDGSVTVLKLTTDHYNSFYNDKGVFLFSVGEKSEINKDPKYNKEAEFATGKIGLAILLDDNIQDYMLKRSEQLGWNGKATLSDLKKWGEYYRGYGLGIDFIMSFSGHDAYGSQDTREGKPGGFVGMLSKIPGASFLGPLDAGYSYLTGRSLQYDFTHPGMLYNRLQVGFQNMYNTTTKNLNAIQNWRPYYVK